MTNDKAREYFSAHCEGALEPGLRASLERRLREDADLREEYAAFVDTVGSLDALRRETIEIPSFLSARLADRLEPAIVARRAPWWQSLVAPFAAGPRVGWAVGIAGVLLVASVALRGLNVRGTNQAAALSATDETPRWVETAGGASVTLPGGAARRAIVTPDGGDGQSFPLAEGQRLALTLNNPNPEARRFAVDTGDGAIETVAVPGTRATGRRTGTGTVRDLAVALAGAYRQPVVVRGLNADTLVRWSFEGLDARAAAERSLAGRGNATLMEGNVLQLGQ